MRGRPVERAPESIRLFAMCEAMNWAHLPVPGGLYDQHPRLLEEWSVIFDRKSRHEAERQREMQRQKPTAKPTTRRR